MSGKSELLTLTPLISARFYLRPGFFDPAFNHEKLFGERAAPQFLQAGELLEKLLTLLPEVWVIG